uniref:Uncharacterized protein n=1 Tax=Triticum urartu TaxID=4572 RepID=A0A8R7QC65_TRIUA
MVMAMSPSSAPPGRPRSPPFPLAVAGGGRRAKPGRRTAAAGSSSSSSFVWRRKELEADLALPSTAASPGGARPGGVARGCCGGVGVAVPCGGIVAQRLWRPPSPSFDVALAHLAAEVLGNARGCGFPAALCLPALLQRGPLQAHRSGQALPCL